MRTNGDWLDSDPFLEVCVCRVIGILSLEHLFPTKGVHESSSTWEVSLRPYLRLWPNIPVPEAPQTIKQNWIPFLTFFFLRILICRETMVSIGM